MRKLIVLLLAAIVFIQPLAVSAQTTSPPWRRDLPGGRDQAVITVGDEELTVDLAYTPAQQSLGLGYRNELEPGTGMLFVFDAPQPRSFWMRGMRLCLDIIWVEQGQIVGAAESVCPDPEGTTDAMRQRYSSGGPVTYVLEVPAGWLQEHGYGPGTPVDLSAVPEPSN